MHNHISTFQPFNLLKMSRTSAPQNLLHILNKRFQLIAIFLLVSFISAQFAILATVGTQGMKVDQVRSQKDELRLENDHLRADIDKAKTLENISAGLDKMFSLTPTGVTVIELPHASDSSTVAANQLQIP